MHNEKEILEEANLFAKAAKIFILIGVLIFVLVTLFLSSCINSESKASRRVANLEKRFPGIIDTTTKTKTVLIHDTFNLKTPPEIDQDCLDSLMRIYCDLKKDTTGDTSVNHKEKEIEKKIYKNIGLPFGKYKLTDQFGDSLTIDNTKGKLMVTRDEKRVTITKTDKEPCPSCDLTRWEEFKKNGLLWVIIFASGFLCFPILKMVLRFWIKV